jgi:hypothetical protein
MTVVAHAVLRLKPVRASTAPVSRWVIGSKQDSVNVAGG